MWHCITPQELKQVRGFFDTGLYGNEGSNSKENPLLLTLPVQSEPQSRHLQKVKTIGTHDSKLLQSKTAVNI
jgi:hypothetical protein